MNAEGLRELDEMAAKLEATARKLREESRRDELVRDIDAIRAQLAKLLALSAE